MFDDISAYYHENVVVTYLEYRDTTKDGTSGQSRDLRRALNSAAALFHLREHLPAIGAISRAEAEKRCPDYALLGDIVNAAKHRRISSNTPHGAPLVEVATSLTESLINIEYTDEEGSYRCTLKSVVAVLSNGAERYLIEVLTNVINFWESYLESIGILSNARSFKFDPLIRHRTREECENNRLNFEVVQGQRFKQRIQLLRFDSSTGTACPIDLTGSTAKFTIYRPKFEVDVLLKHQTTGKELKTMVSLSHEESLILAGLKSEEERQSYVWSLPSCQAALQELAGQASNSEFTED